MVFFKPVIVLATMMLMALMMTSCASDFAPRRPATSADAKMLMADAAARPSRPLPPSACAISSAVVAVYASEAFGVRSWAGSGFVVGDGRHVLTAFHVMRHGGSWSVSALPCDARGERHEGAHAEAVAVAWDAAADVALLEIKTARPWPALARSTRPVGELPVRMPLWLYGAVSFGTPGTLAPQQLLPGWDVTARGEAQSGDSGGAVVDAAGAVVGLAVTKAVRGGEYDFVPIAEVLSALRFGYRSF